MPGTSRHRDAVVQRRQLESIPRDIDQDRRIAAAWRRVLVAIAGLLYRSDLCLARANRRHQKIGDMEACSHVDGANANRVPAAICSQLSETHRGGPHRDVPRCFRWCSFGAPRATRRPRRRSSRRPRRRGRGARRRFGPGSGAAPAPRPARSRVEKCDADAAQ